MPYCQRVDVVLYKRRQPHFRPTPFHIILMVAQMATVPVDDYFAFATIKGEFMLVQGT